MNSLDYLKIKKFLLKSLFEFTLLNGNDILFLNEQTQYIYFFSFSSCNVFIFKSPFRAYNSIKRCFVYPKN